MTILRETRSPDCNDQEDELSRQRNIVDPAEAVLIAHRVYGLSGSVVRFETEKDDTFRLDAADGRQYVLKIANPYEKRAEIEFQVELMRHVQRRDPTLPVPAMFEDRSGNFMPQVVTIAGEARFVRLMSFVPGRPLDSAPTSPRQRVRIGEILAGMRIAMADFSHPADGRAMAWDVTNLPTLAHLIDNVDDPQHRAWVGRVLECFADIEPRLNACRRQVLHNDFNSSNIVVGADDHDTVTGIIDFGDAVRTAIAVDVSTALMNQMPRRVSWTDRTDLFDEARDVLRGYLLHADLTEEELRLVPFLALGRIATRALLTSWRARLFPENSRYILRNTQSGWVHLEWFMSLPNERIAGLLS